MKPLVRRSSLTNPPRYYVVTRYRMDGDAVVATTKYDVTDQIEALFPADASGGGEGLDVVRRQLLAMPLGPNGITSAGWNRYDTDNEHVLTMWLDTWEPQGRSWDIRIPKAATPPAPTPASEDGLIAAAMTLFDPMDHGSPSKPNAGHTPESFCAACVRVRAKRTQAIRRALVALGAMPSVSFRAATTERPAESRLETPNERSA